MVRTRTTSPDSHKTWARSAGRPWRPLGALVNPHRPVRHPQRTGEAANRTASLACHGLAGVIDVRCGPGTSRLPPQAAQFAQRMPAAILKRSSLCWWPAAGSGPSSEPVTVLAHPEAGPLLIPRTVDQVHRGFQHGHVLGLDDRPDTSHRFVDDSDRRCSHPHVVPLIDSSHTTTRPRGRVVGRAMWSPPPGTPVGQPSTRRCRLGGPTSWRDNGALRRTAPIRTRVATMEYSPPGQARGFGRRRRSCLGPGWRAAPAWAAALS